MPVVHQVRNEHNGPVTLTHGPVRDGEEYKWGGKGSSLKDDVQEIPMHVLESPQFRKLRTRGILTVLDDQDSVPDESGAAWQAQEAAKREKLIGAMDRVQANEMLLIPCAAPGERGSACARQVAIRQSKIGDAPPLCEAHHMMADQFIPLPADDGSVTWQYVEV